MRLLFLAEGNPETRDSWSGISKSVMDEFRRRGHSTIPGDVELYGPDRWVAAGLTFSPNRRRWRARYRLGPLGFARRSRRAARIVQAHQWNVGAVLQIGATFGPIGHAGTPYVLFCDSNIRLARDAAATGFGEAVDLSAHELECVEAREAMVYHRANAIFTLSEHTRASFISDFGIPATAVTAVYGGPNFDVADVPEHARHDGTQPPTVLFVGRQFERKGGDILLDAFRRVREQIPTAELLVVGPRRLPVSQPGVRCLGFLDKDRPEERNRLAEAYSSADVFCLPTRFEAFGIVFTEAMHFGVACVGTSVWAVPEIISDGDTGFVVPPDNAEVLASRLMQLLGDHALARRMGAAGRARARRLFTWAAAVDRMLHVLGRLVRRSPASQTSLKHIPPSPGVS